MMAYMKKAASGMQGGSVKGMMGQIGKYAKQVFQNKELWIVLVAFIICTLVVYTLRKQAIAHAWTIAVVTGAVVNIVVVAIGDVAMGVHASYGSLIFGSIGAAVIGVILELFFFSVDYSRSENLQYEDDEYYYYVKAVPKIVVSTPEKTVKRINERQESQVFSLSLLPEAPPGCNHASCAFFCAEAPGQVPAVSIFGSLLHILYRFPVQNTSQHISDYDILTGKLPGSPEVYEATPTPLFHKCVLCYSSHGKIPSLHSGLVSHISGIAVHESLIFPQLSCTKGILPHDLPFHKKGR